MIVTPHRTSIPACLLLLFALAMLCVNAMATPLPADDPGKSTSASKPAASVLPDAFFVGKETFSGTSHDLIQQVLAAEPIAYDGPNVLSTLTVSGRVVDADGKPVAGEIGRAHV